MFIVLAMILLMLLPVSTFLVHLFLLAGVLSNRFRERRIAESGLPALKERVSVVVAAKDEEDSLPLLLRSLERQSFFDFDIILANDRSTDRTLEIMENFRGKLGDRVRVIDNQEEQHALNPKQYILDKAISQARGGIIIFTDADCLLPAGWVEYYLSYFRNPEIGVVFGQISMADRGTFLERYQAFDQPLIHQYSCGCAGLGLPTGCFGNNLAVRRQAIDEIGGFAGLGYTVTEDAALISAVGKKWQVRVSSITSTMIETKAKENWLDFIHQHVRWNIGGFYSKDFGTRTGYRFIVLYLVLSLLLLPFCPLYPILLVYPLTSFVNIGLLAMVSGLLYRKNKCSFLLRFVPYTLFFMFFYSFITVLSILKVSPEWKGKKYRATRPGH